MLFFLFTIIAVIIIFYLFLSQKSFGTLPKGDRLNQIKKSVNYKNGSFQNLSHTPSLTEGYTYFSALKEFLFEDKSHRVPLNIIPSTKTNLIDLDKDEEVLVWFGHSSYFIQSSGKSFLVDPVFSGSASPLSFNIKAFPGSDKYTTQDIPEIDVLFLTHDHWDHLDYKTVCALQSKIKFVVCSLGIAAHLERWGFNKHIIIEKDWNEEIDIFKNFKIFTTPARHFSGRGLRRNKSLWTSFVLETPNIKIFIGGDSGYDLHFKQIGDKFGSFDLVILENGQYNQKWKYIHMMPNEVLQAAKDLKAIKLLPVHSSKFALASHAWDHPLKTITALNQPEEIKILTPMIGEKLNLQNDGQKFIHWWEHVN